MIRFLSRFVKRQTWNMTKRSYYAVTLAVVNINQRSTTGCSIRSLTGDVKELTIGQIIFQIKGHIVRTAVSFSYCNCRVMSELMKSNIYWAKDGTLRTEPTCSVFRLETKLKDINY